eukprot:scaffold674_cov130-Amphora_coffeaeformis.AAC.8
MKWRMGDARWQNMVAVVFGVVVVVVVVAIIYIITTLIPVLDGWMVGWMDARGRCGRPTFS